jgi:hypothetical protein
VLKRLDSEWQYGRRSEAWLKLKPEYLEQAVRLGLPACRAARLLTLPRLHASLSSLDLCHTRVGTRVVQALEETTRHSRTFAQNFPFLAVFWTFPGGQTRNFPIRLAKFRRRNFGLKLPGSSAIRAELPGSRRV